MARLYVRRRRKRGLTCGFLVIITFLCVAEQVEATDIFWDGGPAPAGFDGIFSTVSNWGPIPGRFERRPA